MIKKSILRRPRTFGWVVYVDVYGFTAMLDQKQYGVLSHRLSSCHRELLELPLWDVEPPHLCIFSDSMFMFYPVLKNDTERKFSVMQRCIEDMGDIMGIFAQKDLSLKGGIAYGDVSIGENLLVGGAVARAAWYERTIGVPIVVLPLRELLEKQSEGDFSLPNPPKTQVITLKNGGLMEAHVILPRPLKGFQQLAMKKYEYHRLWGPYDVAKAWQSVCGYIEQIRNEGE